MANKVGPLIKEARTNAGLTQEKLAKKVTNCTAADIGKAERGEKELTQEQLKQIAKATGVTQKSLIDAAKASTYKTSSSSSGTSTKKKTSSSSGTKKSMQVTTTEKKLVELYREADSDTKKTAMGILKGDITLPSGILGSLLTSGGGSSSSGGGSDVLSNLLGGLLGDEK